ncbi:hypothetical protein ZORO111903_19100 [Zobellia roscoffensis]|uniref:hypothetical protein n=1 Tax=Zobellia roscoffensis TaxID=2779508 RepID=UPI00188A8857|nr:hypothetical protein [Zobellia roscoffensis]
MKPITVFVPEFKLTKKNGVTFLFLLILAYYSNAQSVGINTLTPDPAAALDIQSTTGGLLMPRMTTGEMNALVNPPDGLMVYNTDLNNSMMFIQGTAFELYNRVATSAVTILSGIVPTGWLNIGNVSPVELLGVDIYRFQLDLSDVTEMRVVANVTGFTVTLGAQLDIALQYSVDNGTTWAYLNGASFGPGVSISANGLITTPWVEIDAAAKQDVQLRIVGTSNSAIGVQVGFGLLMAEMR